MSPDFSVILPTRGDSEYLRAALGSALASEGDLEVVVIHDRRPGEAPLAPSLRRDPRVRVAESPVPGPSAARNRGMDLARGRFIAFLDDDDLFLAHHLRRSADVLTTQSDATLVACDAYVFEDRTGGTAIPDRPERLERLNPAQPAGTLTLANLFMRNPFATDAVVLVQARLRPEDRFDPDLHGQEDYDFWLRLAQRHRLVFDPDPGVIVRRRAGSASSDRRLMAESGLTVLRRAAAAAPAGSLSTRLINRRLGRLSHELAHACLVQNDVKAARVALVESIRRAPFMLKNYLYAAVAVLRVRWPPWPR